MAAFFTSFSQLVETNPLLTVCASVGIIVLTRVLLTFVSFFLDFLTPGTSLTKYGAGKGYWAVITGCTSGIGEEFALQLAKARFNVFLISRSESKLQSMAALIDSEVSVETGYLPIDFNNASEDDWETLRQRIAELDVAVLINNVGVSHSIPVPFLETSIEEMESIVNVNNTNTLRITQIVAERMLSLKTKGVRGLILTMGSFAGLYPTPLLATYSGSKAFLQNWSSALAYELQPYKIDVQLEVSYLVTSAMSKIRRSSLSIPNPNTFVRATLSSLGRRRGAIGRWGSSTPYWAHAVMELAIEQLFSAYSWVVVSINGRLHEDIRKRALKKRAQKQAATKSE
ncbi:hypothetical protein CANCADRAFT_26095 [Tortispora caseinolytica NRRL Y-17796]|uniref:Very-long-chain 3-oxoacyl-CoA reductase n=1 Tax=Tortispora caseinolytica NRRL Y-17796 TaxID=767744 RepID=A0A1E4TE59_9ASCO|nr:hypothetical protein CANCADRAFT_26095 [Tortispora caseinolytica NRRL Y-17796]